MIKFRSLKNPAHIKSILGERAYRRVRASGVAFDLSDAGARLRSAKYNNAILEMIEAQTEEHRKVWAKEHEQDLAKYSKLIRAKAPTQSFASYDSERIGGRGDSEARRVLAIKIPSRWKDIVHTKWYIDEDDTAHRFLLPSVIAELDHYLTIKWYEILAKQSKPFVNNSDGLIIQPSDKSNASKKTGGAGFIFRRARALPRLTEKVLAWFGKDWAKNPANNPDIRETKEMISYGKAEDLCDNQQQTSMVEHEVGDYAEYEVRLSPKWGAKDERNSRYCEWKSGASINIRANIDIRDHKGRALARKIASLLVEAKKEVIV
jgi:hypothetical protein